MADHPWPVPVALDDIAKLLLYQRADILLMAVPMTAGQILPAHDLRLVSASFIALMRYPVVGRENSQHRRSRPSWRRQRAIRARNIDLPLAHRAPIPEWTAILAFVVIERHISFLHPQAIGADQ